MKKVIKIIVLLIMMYNMFYLAKVKTQEFILQIEEEAIERYLQEKENESQHVAKKLTPQVVNEYVLAQEGIRI